MKWQLKNKRGLLLAGTLWVAMLAHAQWRVGVMAGADYNSYSVDKHYMLDYKNRGEWGVTFGVTGQYDFNSWLGVRTELNFTQKNHRFKRETIRSINYWTMNNYLQVPVMASFSFGGERLRGFCNAGVYGGYWLSSSRRGTDYNVLFGQTYKISESIDFNSERDQRWDAGFVGGMGVEYRFANRWAAQLELRYYYSTVSTQKKMPHTVDSRYNSTLAIQAGVNYCF